MQSINDWAGEGGRYFGVPPIGTWWGGRYLGVSPPPSDLVGGRYFGVPLAGPGRGVGTLAGGVGTLAGGRYLGIPSLPLSGPGRGG